MNISGRHYNSSRGRQTNSFPGLTVHRDSVVPYYEQLKQVILRQIENGEFGPGDLLPSEHEMCERHGVSRTVVRQAIGELVNEGRLYRMRGKGTFVAKPKLHEQFIESTVGFFEDLTARGHVVESRVMSCEVVHPTKRVRTALELGEDDRAIELVRLRSVNREVVAFTKSYMPYFSQEFYEDLAGTDLSNVSLYRYLEDRWDVRIESGHRSLEAIVATGMLARVLEMENGAPVLAIESVGRDSSGRVVEHFQAWHRADRTRLEMDVVRA